jgi:hypothetical protein
MTHNTFTIGRPRRPLFHFVPAAENAAPARRSVGTVLHGKFLDWLAASDIRKLATRSAMILLLAGLVGSTQFTLGLLTAAAKWNGYRIPLFLALLALTLNAKTIFLASRKWSLRRRGANQHTYQGLPVDELASYLLETRAFTRDAACLKFAISWKKHQRIADELMHHQVLVRGPVNNARVLNEKITREQLVRQLRENFPLAFADGEWVERRGSYHLFLRDKERAEQKERERVERLERRADRAERKLTRTTGLQRLFAQT